MMSEKIDPIDSDRAASRGKSGRSKSGRSKNGRSKNGRSKSVEPGVSSAPEHLLQAREEMVQERNSISIVGTALSPDQERRLAALGDAIGAVDDAINYLAEAPVSGESALPADGRYALGNDALYVELRIDIAGSNIVSGDIFAQAEGVREYLASFRSEPGVTLEQGAGSVAIVAQDAVGGRAQGVLAVTAVSDTEVLAQLFLDDALMHLPLRQTVHLTGRYESDFMRDLGIETNKENGVSLDVSWDFEGRTVTIESCFEDAGFDIFAAGRTDVIPSPSNGKWHDSELHGLMVQYADEVLDRPDWSLQLLMLKRSVASRLLGIMFDSGSRDANELPRQGAAVFTTPIATRADADRKLIQTSVHELGHALNLAHRFERQVGRADSTSFMNYDWRYLGGNNARKFWREFAFTFDPDELAFLRHGPRPAIVPGGAEFHTIAYWENTDGGYTPYVPEVPGTNLDLSIQPPGNGGLFDFAQPVLLTVELENKSAGNINLPWYILDAKAGFLEMVIKRVDSTEDRDHPEGRVFRPIAHRCFDLAQEAKAADIVPPDGKISNNVNLTFGSAGFTFASPGDYRVTAVLTLSWVNGPTLTYRSNALRVRIGYPKSREEERDAMELFRWDVGQYIALGGSDALGGAHDTLQVIRHRRQDKDREITDPLVANIVRCEALLASRESVIYRDGKHDVAPADPALAGRLLQSLSAIAGEVFDPYTRGSTEALAVRLVKLGGGKKKS